MLVRDDERAEDDDDDALLFLFCLFLLKFSRPHCVLVSRNGLVIML